MTWFFEQFLLRPFLKDYRPFDERFAYLFNSYYVAAGPRRRARSAALSPGRAWQKSPPIGRMSMRPWRG